MKEIIQSILNIKDIFYINSKITIFTHKDLDGMGCNILAHLSLNNIVESQSVHYKNDMVNYKIQSFAKKNTQDWILIMDLSISEETANILDKRGRCILIDHHETSLFLNKYNWALVNTKYSASVLCYYFFTINFQSNIDDYKELIDIINDFDLWLLNDNRSIPLNRLYYMLGETKFFNKFITQPLFKLSSFEKQYIDIEEEKSNRYINHKCKDGLKIINTNFGKCCLVIADSDTDMLAKYILDTYDIDYVAIIVSFDKVSLRSKGDFDVSSIAQVYGGGGHKNASSFEISDTATNTFFNEIFNKERR